MDGLSRWERRKLTGPARGILGEFASDLLRSDVKLLLMLTLVPLLLGAPGLSTLDFFDVAGDVVVDADNGCATAGVGINKKVLG